MALDPSIPLSVQPFKINTPFQNLGAIMDLRQKQQQIDANNALEAERRQALAKKTQDEQDAHTLASILSVPGQTPDQVEAQIREKVPSQLTAFQKARADLTDKAATTQKSLQDAAKANADAHESMQKFIANQAADVLSYPEPMRAGVLDLKLSHLDDTWPEAKPMFDSLRQQLAQPGADVTTILNGLVKANTQQREATVNEQNAATSAANAQKPTEASMDAAAQALLTKQASGQALSPEETAQLQAYQERKRTISDPAQIAAANRQAATIAQQNALQQRSQNFTEQQAGRKELQEKVEQPYLDSVEKADLLHNVIDAAKGGNMEAASVQSLLGVLGLVTTEGVKRINSVELGQVSGAGSLLERVKGEVSGLTAGKPLSPKVQQDLSDLADIIAKSARQKYEQGFSTTTKRYSLTDERPIAVAPTAHPVDKRAAAADLLKKNGKMSDPASVDTFLKNNPNWAP